MAKKQPVRPTTQSAKSSNTVSKKRMNETSSFKISKKILIPSLLLLFVALAFLYCMPLVEGKQFSTHDTNQFVAMNKEVADFKADSGRVSLWSSRLFGGMPAYLVGGLEPPTIITYSPRTLLYKAIRTIPDPAMGIVFLLFGAFLAFYILTRKVLYSALGAIAVGFCSANFVSLAAGHITKVNSIAMFLPLFAGTWLTFHKRNYIIGTIIMMVFMFQIIDSSHVQIAYYSFMLIGIYVLYEIISSVIKKQLPHALISTAIFVGALSVAGLMNFHDYLVNDFSKETTRGGAILNEGKMNPSSADAKKPATVNEKGVGFDYATQWSFGYEELGSLLVPNFVGGSSGAGLDEKSNVYTTLISKNVPIQQAGQFVQRMPLYWGSEPFVQGPIYLGAVVIFLFVFGLFAYKGNLKWWLTGSILLCILISLGKNFAVLYRLLYDFVPMFNKFRAPTMILALAEILMVVLGVLGLRDFFDDNISSREDRLRSLKFSAGITGGLLVFFILLGSVFSFQAKAAGGKSGDDQFKEQLTQMTGDQGFSNDIYSALKKDRASMMRMDAIRSLVFVLLAASLLFAFASNKFRNQSVILIVLTALILVDFWTVSKRYLNDSSFEDKTMVAVNSFPETPADAAILTQNKDNARMVDFTGDVFNSAGPAYYHRTIGGYNPAKLRRYQDVIEYGLNYDFQLAGKAGFAHTNYINMLNTRFIKQSAEANGVIINPGALGNAWFVNDAKSVSSPEDEILQVREIDPARTAVVNKEFDSYMKDVTFNKDTTAQNENRFITKVETKNPMRVEYNFKSPSNEFVVFSEVIYRPNEDWISYIDDKPADHIRVNYILRGMKVPAGQHKIRFEFKPKLFATMNTVILLSNAVFYAVIASLLFLLYKKRKPALPVSGEENATA